MTFEYMKLKVGHCHDIWLNISFDIKDLAQVTIQVPISLNGPSLELELERGTVNANSGLFPFMSMIASKRYKLGCIYGIAIRNVLSQKTLQDLGKRKCISENIHANKITPETLIMKKKKKWLRGVSKDRTT